MAGTATNKQQRSAVTTKVAKARLANLLAEEPVAEEAKENSEPAAENLEPFVEEATFESIPDVEIVRSVSTELDLVIEEGVANIVQLLKNADSGVTSSAARVPDEDAFEAKNRKNKNHKRWQHDKNALPEKQQDPPQPPSLDELLSAAELPDGVQSKIKVHHDFTK